MYSIFLYRTPVSGESCLPKEAVQVLIVPYKTQDNSKRYRDAMIKSHKYFKQKEKQIFPKTNQKPYFGWTKFKDKCFY